MYHFSFLTPISRCFSPACELPSGQLSVCCWWRSDQGYMWKLCPCSQRSVWVYVLPRHKKPHPVVNLLKSFLWKQTQELGQAFCEPSPHTIAPLSVAYFLHIPLFKYIPLWCVMKRSGGSEGAHRGTSSFSLIKDRSWRHMRPLSFPTEEAALTCDQHSFIRARSAPANQDSKWNPPGKLPLLANLQEGWIQFYFYWLFIQGVVLTASYHARLFI